MSDDVYCYPPYYTVLINKLDLRDADKLEFFEREFVAARIAQGAPTGDFDLEHLKAIHHHLFQDLYDWAGEIRTVEISKDGHQFQLRRYIETGMANVHRRIVTRNYLEDLPVSAFAELAGQIIGDVNYVHPFREGNGRTQMLYLAQLAENAGHKFDLRQLRKEQWIGASKASHTGNYRIMASCILETIEASPHTHESDRGQEDHEQ